MARRWQHGSSRSAAQPDLASDGAAQPSSLPGSAEQPADESYRRAWDGELYTRAEFRDYDGPDLGEEHWQNAQDELTQWDGRADFVRLELHGVAMLNSQIGLRVSHKTRSLISLRRINDVAVLNSLL